MKLLLTSNGLSNKSIVQALYDLTGKTPEETTVVVIPTASNVEMWDKTRLINDLINLHKQHFKAIEIADISAIDISLWKPALERSDVLFFTWGNTYHLMRWIKKSTLDSLLPTLLKSKVYVGVSAWSMVTAPDLIVKISQIIYDEDTCETEAMKGLDLVDLYVLPHLNSSWFTKARKENIEKEAKYIKRKIYALDDDSALKIINWSVEVISEWERLEYN